MTSWAALRELLIVKYEDFRHQLKRRLGSDDLAQETLHETYLKLDRADQLSAIQRPDSYLFRMALNVAASRRRDASREATRVEIEAALDFADEAAETDRMVEDRLDLEMLQRAIEELPPRQKAVLLAARMQEWPAWRVAESLGISQRLVELELKRALEHCAMRLDRQVTKRFGPQRKKASYPVEGDGEVEETLP
jgi:RNA polymerase sigma-70 factor (ECF subfamily)